MAPSTPSQDGGGSIETGIEELDVEDHRHILVLSEKVLACTSLAALSTTAVVGVGTLVDSVSVAWTELKIDSFQRAERSVTEVDSDQPMNFDELVPVFDDLASQHPVINRVIDTGSTLPVAISDCMSDAEFTGLDLYRRFYADLGIVDQLSVARVFGNRVIGCSVNRERRGFTGRERALLNAIGHVVFSACRLLKAAQATVPDPGEPLLTVVGDPTFLHHATRLGLSEREAEILAQIASGKSNKQIALACDVSPGTVRKHTENIYRQLDVNNRVSATLVALDRLR